MSLELDSRAFSPLGDQRRRLRFRRRAARRPSLVDGSRARRRLPFRKRRRRRPHQRRHRRHRRRLLSGCPLQVSGAANGAAVMAAVFIKDLGFEVFGLIVMMSGVIQIAAGALRFGPVFRAVSPALIQGMLAGIGLLIFASQFHVMVDDTPPGAGQEFGGVVNLWSLPLADLEGRDAWRRTSAPQSSDCSRSPPFSRGAAGRRDWLSFLPAPLVGVGLATAVAAYFALDIKYVPAPDDLLAAVNLPTTHTLGRIGEGAIWAAALSLAFVSSAESLLTATAVDAMQRRTPRTRYNKELVAQGVGNFLCGVLGVLPVSGVIVRSSANVTAGGRTRLSTDAPRPVDSAVHHARAGRAAHHPRGESRRSSRLRGAQSHQSRASRAFCGVRTASKPASTRRRWRRWSRPTY